MGEWKECKLGELVEVKGGKRLPKGDLLVDYDTGHPYIRVTDLGRKWLNKEGLQFVTTEIQKSISRYTVNDGDVILSIVGSIGLTGKIAKELDGANLTENCVKFIAKTKAIDNDYLYYFLSSKTGQEEIDKRVVGSTQPKLPLYNIKDIEILLPSLSEQKSIASVLSSLDDKIDLLHRQNKTIEALAETLFRQWFVEEAEEGWETGKFGDYVEFVKGKKPKEAVEEYSIGLTPQILIETFDTGKTLFSESQNMVIANEKDILMVMDGASSGRAEIGFTGIVGSTIGLFKPISSFNYPLFIFYLLKASESHIREHTTGSAIPHADKALILDLDIQYSSIERIIEFEKMAEVWFEKKKANRNQIRTLTRLRDTLLPKLMSGEVRVRLGEK